MSVEQLKGVYNLHFFVTTVRVAALSSLNFSNLTSYSALTWLLTTAIPYSSNASVSQFGILQVVTRSNSARTYTQTLSSIS